MNGREKLEALFRQTERRAFVILCICIVLAAISLWTQLSR